ncbi:MAG: hypothetical protein Ct9H90mP16_07430 [Candidatus Poseidoniales archaeon]|nr:MAG: hypothetical protein Ct9H90mP16_07430 [Candidatus Poseidoniales archaeon]
MPSTAAKSSGLACQSHGGLQNVQRACKRLHPILRWAPSGSSKSLRVAPFVEILRTHGFISGKTNARHSDLEPSLRVQSHGWVFSRLDKAAKGLVTRLCCKARKNFIQMSHTTVDQQRSANFLAFQPPLTTCLIIGHHPSPYLSRCRFCRPFFQATVA